MPKIGLTDKAVDKLKAAAGERRDYTDLLLPGFRLRISGPTARYPEGSKTFSLIYRFAGMQKRLSLGAYSIGGDLAKARAKARQALDDIEQGKDPAARKEAARSAAEAARSAARDAAKNTIEAVLDEYIKAGAKGNRKRRPWTPRYAEEVRRNFERHVLPTWRGRALASITRREVIGLVGDIADEYPIAANRTLAALSGLCTFALDREIIERSPCTRVTPPGAETPRDRVLNDNELRAFWQATDALGYPWGVYFRILLLTAQRRSEVATMRWADLGDLTKREWLMPRLATKNKLGPHLVPLSQLAADLLGDCPRRGDHVFTTGGHRRRSGRTIALGDAPVSGFSKAKDELDAAMPVSVAAVAPWAVHDLRRTATTKMAGLGVTRFIQDRVTNHSDPGIGRVYDWHDYAVEKRHALDLWAQYIENLTTPPGANVVPLRAEA